MSVLIANNQIKIEYNGSKNLKFKSIYNYIYETRYF